MTYRSPLGVCEDTVEKILNGEGLEVKEFDSSPEEVHAVVLRKTVCYIVCAIIFNAKDEVLMVQEAKPECYKRWYLPAGRMEKAESIIEAMVREVKEESGLECQPITLLLIEEQGSQWIRFTFLAEATGGSLKTEAEADAESIQAQWWDRETPLQLRTNDILCLIDAGLKYREKPRFTPMLPIDLPCHVICQRLLLVFRDPDGELWILLSHKEDPRVPVAVCGRKYSLTWVVRRLARECMPSSPGLNLKPWGILGVQHNGRMPGKTDGICFNMLASVEQSADGGQSSHPPLLENPRFLWHKVVSPNIKEKINQRLTSRSVLPMYSLY
ncbi:8-oxo-dGDP phosphatase NUDT18 [Paramormyrops kingsleyae]|uniref:Nudix (nucleoside diphosphate linked moiety X)-type motif 18 n=1 Tax=Paramormyrops kingsleyae TaxID=1676925 RepID=A0A3B3QWY5_9TELE|nr:8-oxo-dGDP phosphatase NUDT18 [Paramormyrops kingsleyae]